MAKYHQLSQVIRDRILTGKLPPNAQIPTEETLCQEHCLSRGTVRRALDVLQNEGLIRREQGRGMFVNAALPALNPFALVDYEPRPQPGRRFTTRTLAQEICPASRAAAARLNLRAGTPVIHLARLCLMDDLPLVSEGRWLDAALCPGLVHEDLEAQPVHWLLIHKYDLPLIRVTHTIECRALPPDSAQLLASAAGDSAFFVDRLAYTRDKTGERPAVWYQAIYRGDDDQFQAAFHASM